MQKVKTVAPNYIMKAKVTRVLDGDTVVMEVSPAFHIHLRDYKFRLFGIDTPETDSKDPAEKKAGLASKKFTTDAVLGKEVLVESKRMARSGLEKVDSFGRYLAVIYYVDADGVQRNLNQELLEKGLAKVFME